MESTRTTVHLLRHGEVHNPQGVLYGRLPGYHLSERGQQMAQRVADRSATATSPTSSPRRWSGRRRPRRRWRRSAGLRSSPTSG